MSCDPLLRRGGKRGREPRRAETRTSRAPILHRKSKILQHKCSKTAPELYLLGRGEHRSLPRPEKRALLASPVLVQLRWCIFGTVLVTFGTESFFFGVLAGTRIVLAVGATRTSLRRAYGAS